MSHGVLSAIKSRLADYLSLSMPRSSRPHVDTSVLHKDPLYEYLRKSLRRVPYFVQLTRQASRSGDLVLSRGVIQALLPLLRIVPRIAVHQGREILPSLGKSARRANSLSTLTRGSFKKLFHPRADFSSFTTLGLLIATYLPTEYYPT